MGEVGGRREREGEVGREREGERGGRASPHASTHRARRHESCVCVCVCARACAKQHRTLPRIAHAGTSRYAGRGGRWGRRGAPLTGLCASARPRRIFRMAGPGRVKIVRRRPPPGPLPAHSAKCREMEADAAKPNISAAKRRISAAKKKLRKSGRFRRRKALLSPKGAFLPPKKKYRAPQDASQNAFISSTTKLHCHLLIAVKHRNRDVDRQSAIRFCCGVCSKTSPRGHTAPQPLGPRAFSLSARHGGGGGGAGPGGGRHLAGSGTGGG